MQVTIGPEGRTKTWQIDFSETAVCCRCQGEARLGFVAHEGLEGNEAFSKGPFVCNLYPNNGKGDYWLHDVCAVAVYFCKECLQPTALYNQG